jgi:allantoicase
LTDFTQLIDLASERLRGAVLAANDEFFAPKEGLLRAAAPMFREGEYTDRGKWMDGWETRRRREPGHDWCVVRLGFPGLVRGFVVDTTHFKGNAPEYCSIDACEITGREPDAWEGGGISWEEILPRSPLSPDSHNLFAGGGSHRATHVRLRIYPDGGIARLRVHGEVVPDWERLARAGGEVDLAATENGGRVVLSSDEFFGSRHNLILPGNGLDMRDGWETRRRRGPGHDWVIVRLGRPGSVRRIDVDTLHFKGNAPGRCSVEVCRASDAAFEAGDGGAEWEELMPEITLRPDTLHRFEAELIPAGEATHARLNIFPDGGVSRLRLWAPAPASSGGPTRR